MAKFTRINVYTCPECGGETVTTESDDGNDRGVTPFMLGCRANGKERPDPGACRGMAMSSMYRPRPGHPPPAWEWYRPTAAEATAAGPAMEVHAARGGYFLRRLSGPSPSTPNTKE